MFRKDEAERERRGEGDKERVKRVKPEHGRKVKHSERKRGRSRITRVPMSDACDAFPSICFGGGDSGRRSEKKKSDPPSFDSQLRVGRQGKCPFLDSEVTHISPIAE